MNDAASSEHPAHDDHLDRGSRREMLRWLAAAGVGTAVFQRALAAQADQAPAVTPDMVRQAEWISGLVLDDKDRETLARGLTQQVRATAALRAEKLTNDIPLPLAFQPAPWLPSRPERGQVTFQPAADLKRPPSDDDLAFLPATALAALLRARQVSSVELTRLYLGRLKKYDPLLKCVVTLAEDLALKQAAEADKEITAERCRGPLHGIPWGAKDLVAYPGLPTTWGAAPFQKQVLDVKATVARRLEEAGAVLAAKLSLGALAMGDRWFGGMTRSPWDPAQGSSGSSAGSAAAVAAGLVGFAVGSETHGSIVSPCRQCGATGLRPTFGRVSRHGCMTLAWSMDKLGPIARSAEDCALVFGAIHGFDGLDAAAVDRPFPWPPPADLKSLRVGFFEAEGGQEKRDDLRVLRDLGVTLVPVKLPENKAQSLIRFILDVEAAAAFDELARQGTTEGLNSWPGIFRRGAFVTATDYLRANRLRTRLMAAMRTLMEQVDLYVGGDDLALTNLTGHPTVVLPDGSTRPEGKGIPKSKTFTGRLYGETELLAVARAYQQATGYHLARPTLPG